MADDERQPRLVDTVFNIPNQLTIARLVLAVVLFLLMTLRMFLPALVVFLIAASTDWLDGYIARKYGMITVLGRILDPFADKLIICGTFIFLVAEKESHVSAWMAVVIVSRELLVTALRSFLEQGGADFSATMSGKLKMVLQCVAAAWSLTFLWCTAAGDVPGWMEPGLTGAVWSAVVLTVYSGVAYVVAASRMIGA